MSENANILMFVVCFVSLAINLNSFRKWFNGLFDKKMSQEEEQFEKVYINTLKEKEKLEKEFELLARESFKLEQDLKREREKKRKIQKQSVMDSLTGVLLNRGVLKKAVTREINRSKRSGMPISYMFLDLDNFKKVNDNLGHLVGDEVLKAVAKLLVRHVRSGDIVARFGGDEFIVVLSGSSTVDVETIYNRLNEGIKKIAISNGIPDTLNFGASIGVVIHDHKKSYEQMMDLVDKEMYIIKNGDK